MSSADTCPFCRIARGESPAAVLHRDSKVMAFRDIRPAAPTHILVIPVRHLTSLEDMTAEDGGLMSHMTSVACSLAEHEGVDAQGYRLVINTGPDAGQSVFHLHMHLLAGRRMGWPPG